MNVTARLLFLREGFSIVGRYLSVMVLMLGTLACAFTEPSPYNCDNMPDQYRDVPEVTEYMYILWRPSGVSQATFEQNLFSNIVPDLESYNPTGLKVVVQDEDIKSITLRDHPRADGSPVAAVVTFGAATDEEAMAVAQVLEDYGQVSFVAGYKVARAILRDYPRNWLDGIVSPGVVQMTFLTRKSGMGDQAFQDYWFCSHGPFALEIHPIWRYERNRVVESFTENAPNYDGIVGLHMQTDKELTSANLFLNGNVALWGLRVQADVSNFLDLSIIEVSAMREYILQSDFVAAP